MSIRLAVPEISEKDLAEVTRVLQSGFLVQGKEVLAFEAAFARYVGVPHAIAVSNCTAALHMALVAIGVGKDDIVLTTTYSWPATANAVELVGARPHFVDIEQQTFGMCPAALRAAIDTLRSRNDLAQVKAILPVHAFGQLAAIEAIVAIGEEHAIPVLEDAACALGASRGGIHAGAFGLLGCFSFHPRKALTTGEGGMITTSDAELAGKLRALRNHGLDPNSTTPDFILPGFNYRMTEFQAALGTSQLSRFDQMLAVRRNRAKVYHDAFRGTVIRAPNVVDSTHAYQSYVVLLPKNTERQAVISGLKEAGIESTIGTYAVPQIRYFRERYRYAQTDFPTTTDIASRALTLPLHAFLSEADQAHVVSVLLGLVT